MHKFRPNYSPILLFLVLLAVSACAPDVTTPAPTSVSTVTPEPSATSQSTATQQATISSPPAPPPVNLEPTATLEPSTPRTLDPNIILPPAAEVQPADNWTPESPEPFNPSNIEAWTYDYLKLVAMLLNANDGDGKAVQEQLMAWIPQGTALPAENMWYRAVDMDQDGVNEIVMTIPHTDSGLTGWPYYVLVFEQQQTAFTPVTLVGGEGRTWTLDNPTLLALEDLTNDGLTELLLRHENCGAHTCVASLIVGRWDGKQWQDLAATPIEQATAEVYVEDRDADGTKELVLYGGLVGSVGAGLQRPHTLIYAWKDGMYRLSKDLPDPGIHPYHKLLDANIALRDGDPERALELAGDILNGTAEMETDPYLDAWSRSRILSYATIEVMLAKMLQGNGAAIQNDSEQLASRTDIVPNPYIDAAQHMSTVYQATGDPLAACYAMEKLLLAAGNDAEFFESYGYNMEYLTPEDLCPID